MSFTSDLIQKHEGLRLHVYKDTAGKPTIGYGFNLNSQGARPICNLCGLDYDGLVAGTVDLTQEQADAIFEHQLGMVETQAGITFKNFEAMPANVQAVIADLIFNLGWAGFLEFHQTILALKAGNWGEAADNLIQSKWYLQVPSRAKEDIALLRAA
jgi:lysozyme